MTAGDSGNPQLDVAPSQDTTPQPNDAMPEGEVAGPDASVDVGPEVLVDSWSPDSGGFVDVGIVPDGGCLPQCINKECGIDGCGGFCGFCPEAAPECSMEGLCQAVPSSSDCKDIFSRFNKVMTVEVNYSDDPNAPMITAENRRYAQLATLLRVQTLVDVDCWSVVYGHPLQPDLIEQALQGHLDTLNSATGE